MNFVFPQNEQWNGQPIDQSVEYPRPSLRGSRRDASGRSLRRRDRFLALPVLREGHGLHLLRRHEREEAVPDDVAIVLEPEIAYAGMITTVAEQAVQLFERELTLADTDGIDVGEDGVFGVNDRVYPAPDDEGGRVDLTKSLGSPAGSGRRSRSSKRSPRSLRPRAARRSRLPRPVQLPTPAVGAADCAAHAAIAVGRDVAGLRVGIEARNIGRDLTEAAGRNPVLETHQPGTNGATVRRSVLPVERPTGDTELVMHPASER